MKPQQKQNKKKKLGASRASTSAPVRALDSTRYPEPLQNSVENEDQIKKRSVVALLEAFEEISIEDAMSAITEANGDVDRAAEILANLTESITDTTFSNSDDSDAFWSLNSGSSSSSNGSGCTEIGFGRERYHGKGMAVAGSVGAVIGKDYLNKSVRRVKGETEEREEKEQLLWDILGDDCEFSFSVVKDVLCQCGYNVDKALDILLDLSGFSCNSTDSRLITEHSANSTYRAFDSFSHSSETELDDKRWGYDCRSYAQVLTGEKAPPRAASRNDKANLPQKVLESLFNIPKSSEHEPNSMNWKNVIKKMQSLEPGYVCSPSDPLPHQDLRKVDEYQMFRQSATQHWDSMKSSFQEASGAYSKGHKDYAAYLSDKGRVQAKKARKADENASRDIFVARNKDIENVVTIDLHGQHVKEAMKILKLHLAFGTCTRSIQVLRVITGCVNHGLGKAKIKQAVVKLVEKEGMKWKEENKGALLINLDGYKVYKYEESDGDSD